MLLNREYNSKKFQKLNDFKPIHHTGQKISGVGLQHHKLSQEDVEDNISMRDMQLKPINTKLTILEELDAFGNCSIEDDMLVGNTPSKEIRDNDKTTKQIFSLLKKRKRIKPGKPCKAKKSKAELKSPPPPPPPKKRKYQLPKFITASDLAVLSPGKWINDNIINYYTE